VKIAVGVACYNDVSLSISCLESFINRESGKNEVQYRCVLNFPKEEDAEAFRQKIKTLQNEDSTRNFNLISFGENVGFVKAHNFMSSSDEVAEYDWYVCANDDLIVEEENWDEKLCKEIDGPAMIAPKAGASFFTVVDNVGIIGHLTEELEKADYFSGCLFSVNKYLINFYGHLFDPEYDFAYFEDADLSLRVRFHELTVEAVDFAFKHIEVHGGYKDKTIDIPGKWVKNQGTFLRRWKHYFPLRNLHKRVLVVRTAALGDVFLTTGPLKAFKLKNPYCKLYVATSKIRHNFGALLENNPYIDGVIDIEERTLMKFDEIYELNDAYEVGKNHIVEDYCVALKVPKKKYPPEIYFVEGDKIDLPEKPCIAIDVSTTPGWGGKNVPLEFMQEFVDFVKKTYGYEFVQIGKSTREIKGAIDYRNKYSIRETAFLLATSLGYIGPEGGLSHIAQSVNIPTGIFFGHSVPEHRVTNKEKVVVFKRNVTCLGCHDWMPTFPGVHEKYYNQCLRQMDKDLCMRFTMEELKPALVKFLKKVSKREKEMHGGG